MTRRDPATGKLTHPVSIDVRIAGERTRMYSATSWDAAADFLRSPEFREIAERVDFVTINHTGVVA